MKFNLDTKVIYDGSVFIVWDYNERHKEYTLTSNWGNRIFGVKEEQLKLFTL